MIPWDFRFYHLPIYEFVARSFRAWELPLWDPFTYCGMPLYADLTSQVFYPPTVLTILFSNLLGGGRLGYWMEVQLAAHVWLGGLFTFLLLRRMGAVAAASLAGATVYQLGCFFASQTQHIGGIDTAAWLPGALLPLLALRQNGSAREAAWLALALAMVVLSGYPAVGAVAFWFCGALCLVWIARGEAKWTLAPWFAIAVVWAVALAAIQVLPTAQLSRLSVASLRSKWLLSGGGVPFQAFVSLLIPDYYHLFDTSKFRLPFNLTFLYTYCGLAGLACVIRALWKRSAAAFAWMLLFSTLWMLGDSTPLGPLVFRLLPEAVRAPLYAEFALLGFSMAMAILAGMGAHTLLEGRSRWLGAALVAVLAVDLTLTGSGRPMNTGSKKDEPGVSYEHFDGIREIPTKMRELTGKSVPPARIDQIGDTLNWAGAAMMTQIPTANGNNAFALLRLMQARLVFAPGEEWGRFYEPRQLDSPMLAFVGVRYLVSRGPLPENLAGAASYRKVLDLPGHQVFENPTRIDRFHLVRRVRPSDGARESARVLRGAGFQPAEEAVVEDHRSWSGSGEGSVRVTRYASRELELEVDAQEPGFLVTSEAHYPGWRAWVDGVETPIAYSNAAFRGLDVPAGKHSVRMQFDPAIWKWGTAVSLAALLAALTALRRRAS